MNSNDWYQGLSDSERKKLNAFEKEKMRIEKSQERLDDSWEKELKRRTRIGHSDPLGSMFEDGTSDQYNQQSQWLNDRRETNQGRIEDLI